MCEECIKKIKTEGKCFKEQEKFIDDLDEIVKWWVLRKNQPCRMVRRDYVEFQGFLVDVFFTVDSLVFYIKDTERDYVKNTETEEDRLINIKANNIVDVEFILDSKTRELPREK